MDVAVNHDNATHIFPAKTDQQRGITIRYPSVAATRLVLTIEAAFSRAELRGYRVEFPKSDQFNYVQIEIGDWTGASQWQ